MKKTSKNSTYEEVVEDAGSAVKLICIKPYSGTYQFGIGGIAGYSYKKGDVLPRNRIFLKEKNWELLHKNKK